MLWLEGVVLNPRHIGFRCACVHLLSPFFCYKYQQHFSEAVHGNCMSASPRVFGKHFAPYSPHQPLWTLSRVRSDRIQMRSSLQVLTVLQSRRTGRVNDPWREQNTHTRYSMIAPPLRDVEPFSNLPNVQDAYPHDRDHHQRNSHEARKSQMLTVDEVVCFLEVDTRRTSYPLRWRFFRGRNRNAPHLKSRRSRNRIHYSP